MHLPNQLQLRASSLRCSANIGANCSSKSVFSLTLLLFIASNSIHHVLIPPAIRPSSSWRHVTATERRCACCHWHLTAAYRPDDDRTLRQRRSSSDGFGENVRTDLTHFRCLTVHRRRVGGDGALRACDSNAFVHKGGVESAVRYLRESVGNNRELGEICAVSAPPPVFNS